MGAIFFQISEKGAILKMSLGNPGLEQAISDQQSLSIKQIKSNSLNFDLIYAFTTQTWHLNSKKLHKVFRNILTATLVSKNPIIKNCKIF